MAVAGIGVALALASTVAGVAGSVMQYEGQKRAEEVRKNQMADEAMRQRREQIRAAQVNRAKVTASAYNEGAGLSSALSGGQAQIAGTAGRNLQYIGADQTYANQLFSAQSQITEGGFIQNLGGGIASLGNAVSSNAGTITRLFA